MSTLTETPPDLSEGSPLLVAPAEKPAPDVANGHARPAAEPPAKATATKPELPMGTRAVKLRNERRRLDAEAKALADEKQATVRTVREVQQTFGAHAAELQKHAPTVEQARAIVAGLKTDPIGTLRRLGYDDATIRDRFVMALDAAPDPKKRTETEIEAIRREQAQLRADRETEKYNAAQQQALTAFVADTRTTAAQHPNLARALKEEPDGEQFIRVRSLEIATEYANKRDVELTDPQIRKLLEKEVADYYRAEDAKKAKAAPAGKPRATEPDVLTMTPDELLALTKRAMAEEREAARAEDAADEPELDPLIGRDGKPITEEEERERIMAAVAKATATEAPKYRKSRVDGTYRRRSAK
jgi:hypothetical protein